MIICSISTIPGRFNSLLIVLNSIIDQTVKPDLIVITISKYYPRSGKSYPEDDLKQLKNLESTFSIPVKIIEREKDIGPTVKLISPLGELELCDDDLIIIADDDNVLYKETIRLLVEGYKKYGTAVYGIMGKIGEHIYVHGEKVKSDYQCVELLGGYRGVLYPVKIFKTRQEFLSFVCKFIEENKKKGLIAMHDDEIFSYYAEYENIERRVVSIPGNGNVLHYHPIQNDDGIFNDNRCYESLKIVKEVYEGLKRKDSKIF
jgi:hypothetical protein